MAGEVLIEEHQSNGGDNTARNSQPGNRSSARKHTNEEQQADSDNEKGPEGTPEIVVLEYFSKKGQHTKDDQQAAADQRAGIAL